MEKSKVYYTDFHARKLGEGLPTKLQLLAKKAGIANLDLEGKFVAIKMLWNIWSVPGKMALLHLL